MVLVSLHAYALDGMYTAVDFCRGLADDLDDLYWDRAFAALSGWAEETEDASGFLFMEIPRYLCRISDTCTLDANSDSELNRQLLLAVTNGKESLNTGDCDAAEGKVKEVEKMLQAALVDVVAYFAKVISDDPLLKDNLAEGCEYSVLFGCVFSSLCGLLPDAPLV